MIIFRDAAILQAPIESGAKVVYSSEATLINKSFDIRVSNDSPKRKGSDKRFMEMGFFEIKSISSLKRGDKMEINKELYKRQAQRNILNMSVWNGPNLLDQVIAFPKLIAQLYEIDHNTTVALLSEPFKNAWALKDLLKSPRRDPQFYA
ncbi:MAG: hypothetical protein KGH53_01465 [Candidatus Micrarchaeota archaeon]|nr:hypothetical protein [Candidatus Micrarchaeota archaeon]